MAIFSCSPLHTYLDICVNGLISRFLAKVSALLFNSFLMGRKYPVISNKMEWQMSIILIVF